MSEKENTILSILKLSPKLNSNITEKITIAVPSFNKDSPSTKVLNLTLAPNSFSKATTATGSVALNIAPNIKASDHFKKSYIKMYLTTNPVIKVLIKTPGTANKITCNNSCLKVYQS